MSNTELLKEKLHLLIEKIEDENTLQNYKAFLEDELNTKNDWYEEIPDAVKIRLQKSILQIKGGKAKDLETVLNKY
jgi:hypothetical protein